MKYLARIGCLSRSVVYLVIGVLALLVAIGNPHGATTDTRGALRLILAMPFGSSLLLILGLGLESYGVWRLFQSVQDHDRYGRSFSGLCMRTGFFLSGGTHLLLGLYAFNLVFGWSRVSGWGERMLAKSVLALPFGNWALELAGGLVVIVGFFQILRSLDGSFMRDLRFPQHRRRMWIWIARLGLLARGMVFTIVGTFFFQAGWKMRSREAGGLPKAWEILHQQPFGNFVLGAVAIGFIAFALFGFLEGFYRRSTAKG